VFAPEIAYSLLSELSLEESTSKDNLSNEEATCITSHREIPDFYKSLKKRRGDPCKAFQLSVTKKKLRPETLKQIVELKKYFEQKEHTKVLSIGLHLLYAHYGDGKKTLDLFDRLSKEFPPPSNSDTFITEEEVIPTAKIVFSTLETLGRKKDALILCVNLYDGGPSSYRTIPQSHKSYRQCFVVLIRLCLVNKEYEQISKRLVKSVGRISKRNWDTLYDVWELLNSVRWKPSDLRNFQRSLDRASFNYQKRKGEIDTGCAAICILQGHHHLTTSNHVKALRHYFDARRIAPGNPIVLLCIASCYIKLSIRRGTTKPNLMLMKAFSFLQEYANVRSQTLAVLDVLPETYSGSEYETKSVQTFEILYNIGISYEKANISFLAEKYLRDALEVQKIPQHFKREAAYALANIYRRSGNKSLAAGVLKKHFTV